MAQQSESPAAEMTAAGSLLRSSRSLSERALLLRFASARTPALRDEVVRRFMPLARSLAMRYRGGAEPIEDLIQIANLGLVNAVDRFDSARGTPFVPYAVPTILGELRRHFRDRVWNLRLPRGLQELTMRIDAAVDRLTEEIGHAPTPSEIADNLCVSLEEVLEGLAANQARRTLSLDAPVNDEADATTAVAMIADSEPGYDKVEAEFACEEADLDEREWRVLRMRFVDNLAQSEIGGVLGISQMQVSRINRRALSKLLAAVRGERAPQRIPPST